VDTLCGGSVLGNRFPTSTTPPIHFPSSRSTFHKVMRSSFGGCVHLGCPVLLLQSICKLPKDNRGRPRDIQRDVYTSNTNARSSSTPSTVATIVGAVTYIRRPPIPRTLVADNGIQDLEVIIRDLEPGYRKSWT
jgi:hypothetical protein